MIIELKSSKATAKIETKGAELISLKNTSGEEYVWQKNPDYWQKASPLLFPIVGNLDNNKINFSGKEYTIPKHGFAAMSEFKVINQTADMVELNFSYDAETLAMYPYKFSLTLTYTLTGEQISIDYTVQNVDDKPIDYSIGAHPGFNVPIGEGCFEDYCLEFEKNEGSCTTYILDKLYFDPNNQIDLTKGGNVIDLDYSLFDSDAFVFDAINSKSLKLKSKKTGRGIQFDFKGFASIAFWTPIKKNAPFLCLEPWNGMAFRAGEDNHFEHKFGIKHLAVNEKHSLNVTILPL